MSSYMRSVVKGNFQSATHIVTAVANVKTMQPAIKTNRHYRYNVAFIWGSFYFLIITMTALRVRILTCQYVHEPRITGKDTKAVNTVMGKNKPSFNSFSRAQITIVWSSPASKNKKISSSDVNWCHDVTTKPTTKPTFTNQEGNNKKTISSFTIIMRVISSHLLLTNRTKSRSLSTSMKAKPFTVWCIGKFCVCV